MRGSISTIEVNYAADFFGFRNLAYRDLLIHFKISKNTGSKRSIEPIKNDKNFANLKLVEKFGSDCRVQVFKKELKLLSVLCGNQFTDFVE